MSTRTMTQEAAKNVKNLPLANIEKTAEDLKKADIAKTIEKFKPEPIISADSRIELVKQFQELSKRYNLLKEKDNDLKLFIAGDDKTNTKITFENTAGFKFVIQNTNVIARLSKEASDELNILLRESENEVLTFQM